MIKDCKALKLGQILGADNNFFYDIPKYQREYTWSNHEWKELFDDIASNDIGYFLGSFICVNQSHSTLSKIKLQVIDGQQRITSLSLLLLAIYNKLSSFKNEFTESKEDMYRNLKRELVFVNDVEKFEPRVKPQIQGKNQEDYYSLLTSNKLMEGIKQPNYATKRKMYKCYNFFLGQIDEYVKEKKSAGEKEDKILFNFLESVNSTVMVFIEVESNKDAYMLFESLNNRGIPLSAIDLIKNLLISKADDENDKTSAETCYKQWEKILEYLSDDYSVQERFFRQFYNAYRDKLNRDYEAETKGYHLDSLATKSSMLKIYEKLIEIDYQSLLNEMEEQAKTYSIIINNIIEEKDKVKRYEKPLIDLSRIGGSPSYLLLMVLISNKRAYKLREEDIGEIIELLVKFFVRRNITDYPNTRNLNKIFMDINTEISKLEGKEIFEKIRKMIIESSASNSIFEDKLKGPLYQINAESTRFLLCYYEEKYSTKEIHTDLWKKDEKNRYNWTIEHIFPEGENIPKSWVDMIADGDEALAKQIHEEYVHKIGNLTITGYNPNLSNMAFKEKKERKQDEDIYIGYMNGLRLNEDVVTEDRWTKEKIEKRSNKLIKVFMKDFSL